MISRFGIILIAILISGCGAKQHHAYQRPTMKAAPEYHTVKADPNTPGIYHTVKKGQTLWGISRGYCVDINALADFNKIINIKKIETGQKIFIPDCLRKGKKVVKEQMDDSFVWPCKGIVVQGFNTFKQNVKNQGIDISAKNGSSVNAAAAGNIVFTSENFRGYGQTIIIEHSNGFQTVYANNQKNLVKKGEFVRQGQVIARAGSSGRASECLVHFQIRKNNKPQNPILYLP